MESQRTSLREVSPEQGDQVLRAWLRVVGDYGPREPDIPPPFRWSGLTFRWTNQYLDDEEFSKRFAILYGTTLHEISEKIINGLLPLGITTQEAGEKLSGFEKVMQEKKDRQYGPPHARPNFRHRGRR